MDELLTGRRLVRSGQRAAEVSVGSLGSSQAEGGSRVAQADDMVPDCLGEQLMAFGEDRHDIYRACPGTKEPRHELACRGTRGFPRHRAHPRCPDTRRPHGQRGNSRLDGWTCNWHHSHQGGTAALVGIVGAQLGPDAAGGLAQPACYRRQPRVGCRPRRGDPDSRRKSVLRVSAAWPSWLDNRSRRGEQRQPHGTRHSRSIRRACGPGQPCAPAASRLAQGPPGAGHLPRRAADHNGAGQRCPRVPGAPRAEQRACIAADYATDVRPTPRRPDDGS